MTKETLSVAVIGAGMAGRTHADGWRQANTIFTSDLPRLRLATIADAFLPFAQAAARDYGYEKATDNWKDIVNDPDIDIVSIVVGNKLHREMAEALVKAGKHALCEKPLTDNLEDAKAMAEFGATDKVVTGLGYCYRRNPGLAKIADMVQSGQLGKSPILTRVTGATMAVTRTPRSLGAIRGRWGRALSEMWAATWLTPPSSFVVL